MTALDSSIGGMSKLDEMHLKVPQASDFVGDRFIPSRDEKYQV